MDTDKDGFDKDKINLFYIFIICIYQCSYVAKNCSKTQSRRSVRRDRKL